MRTTRTTRPFTPNGIILYRGPSSFDGSPIVVILTGLRTRSANGKTGAMLQTWILREDVDPCGAVKTGADSAICGACPLRGVGGKHRACYVNVGQAPGSVWRAYHRGVYAVVPSWYAARLVAGKALRIGSYGDPAAVPSAVWSPLVATAARITGYSHVAALRGLDAFAPFAPFTMYSADTREGAAAAHAAGFRTFRVLRTGETMLPGEIACPSARVSCSACGLCDGLRRADVRRLPSIAIPAHGIGKRYV